MRKQDIKPGDKVRVSAVVESLGHDDAHIIVRIGRTPVQVSAGAVFPDPGARPDESQQFQVREAREALARWDASQDAPGIYSIEGTLAAHLRNVLEITALLGAGTGQED